MRIPLPCCFTYDEDLVVFPGTERRSSEMILELMRNNEGLQQFYDTEAAADAAARLV